MSHLYGLWELSLLAFLPPTLGLSISALAGALETPWIGINAVLEEDVDGEEPSGKDSLIFVYCMCYEKKQNASFGVC